MTIGAGDSSGSFDYTSGTVSAATAVTVTATLGSSSASTTVTVTPISVLTLPSEVGEAIRRRCCRS